MEIKNKYDWVGGVREIEKEPEPDFVKTAQKLVKSDILCGIKTECGIIHVIVKQYELFKEFVIRDGKVYVLDTYKSEADARDGLGGLIDSLMEEEEFDFELYNMHSPPQCFYAPEK